jgi:hypothetical protein
MSVKRFRDPAGLLPDRLSVDFREPSPDDVEAVDAIFQAVSPRGRIERLKRHAEIQDLADALLADFEAAGTMTAEIERRLLKAEQSALYLDAAPRVTRDNARQAGTRKGRRPEIDDWIDRQLSADPRGKTPDLWKRAPEWLTDQIGPDRFAKRVTASRKRVASK